MSDNTIKYLEPYSEEWHKLNYKVLQQSYSTHACKNCGHPVISGYCCEFCRDENPYYETKKVIKENEGSNKET